MDLPKKQRCTFMQYGAEFCETEPTETFEGLPMCPFHADFCRTEKASETTEDFMP